MADDYPTSIRLDASLKDDLVQRARAQGCSLTWLISWVLKEWIDRQKAKK